jgi:hypothetical protein
MELRCCALSVGSLMPRLLTGRTRTPTAAERTCSDIIERERAFNEV